MSRKYWYSYLQYFYATVLVLVSAILDCQSIVIRLTIVFTSIVNIPEMRHCNIAYYQIFTDLTILFLHCLDDKHQQQLRNSVPTNLN